MSEFQNNINEILASHSKSFEDLTKEDFERLRRLNINLELFSISKITKFGNVNAQCWKDVKFNYSEIINNYDARRDVIDKMGETVEDGKRGVILYENSFSGKSMICMIIKKRAMIEILKETVMLQYMEKVSNAQKQISMIL